MSIVLDLEPGRRTPLRLLLVLGALALALLWFMPLPALTLFDAPLIPTFLWSALAVFAFAGALFTLCIAAVSSRIIWDMFGLLLRTS